MINKALEIVVEHGPTALAILGAPIALLIVVAPLTKTKLDDKLLGVFTKVRDVLAWVIAKGQSAETVKAVADKKPGVVARLTEKFDVNAKK